MSSETVQITGLKELNEALNHLEEALSKRLMRAAARKAAALFRNAMKATVHRSSGQAHHASSGSKRPHLADDLKIRLKKSEPGTVIAQIGPSKKTSYIANFLEYGTAPHTIKAKRGKSLFIPGTGFAKSVSHPGSPAHPFMRPAFDTQVNAVIEKFKSSLASAIEKMKGA